MSKSSSLETLARHTLEGDRQLRQYAPPVDWDSIADEGAQRFREQWDADPGDPLIPEVNRWLPAMGNRLIYSLTMCSTLLR
jgi:hypothetical protein